LITEEQYNTEYAPKLQAEKNMLNDERFQINESFNQVRSDSTSIDNIAASEYAIQAEKGNVLSGATYSFLEGAESSLRFLLETGDFKDGEFKGFLTQAAPGSISDVYTSAEGRNAFEQIIFGLANSGGSALVSAASGSTLLGLYASSYVNMKDQMSTPQFKDVPEYQKILMSGIYGATIGYLENKGIGKWFQKTPAGKGLTNWILKKTISELGKDATAETIELTIKKNLGAAIKNGLIQVTASGLVEGSTELAQEATDMAYKEVFNIMSEKKYFDNPTSWTDVADRLGKSFVLGFAGGAGMQSITQATQVGMNELDKNQINNITELINSPELKDVFRLNLKDQILSGQISKEEAKRQIQKINEIEGTLNKIPEKVDRFQAFKLINERDAIQKEIAGKDPALVAAQTERVNAINDELKQLSYAVQEQATSEVPVQPGAKIGGEVAQGKPETGLKETTQEGSQAQEVEQGKFVAEEATRLAQENISTEQRQSLVDRLYEDPIAYARENNTPGSPSENFINSLEQPINIENKSTKEIASELNTIDNTDLIKQLGIESNWDMTAEGDLLAGNDPVLAYTQRKLPQWNRESQLGNINPESELTYDIVKGRFGSVDNKNVVTAKDENGVIVGVVELASNGGIEHIAVAPEFRRKGVANKLIEVLKDNNPNLDLSKTKLRSKGFEKVFSNTIIAEAYKKAKQDGSNPTLVKAVEDSLSNKNLVSSQKQTKFAQDETGNIQPERTGDGRGRTESRKFTPLEGAPAVPGINGPDPQLVGVAEKYAADNGIELKRQSEYVEVDEQRAKRIADAYEQMANNPQDPKVKEAYQDLINQTIAQYQALVDAGYKFWFMDLNIPSNEEYAASPYNALRDLRQNKEMGVFPTTDGYGEGDITQAQIDANPLLADTGIKWPVGGLDGEMKPVLANDLFRAVHDAFGHGLEGAGFRARGEENAWQAHVRLFTGPAVGAITSETRGQNSWLNYGPFGETNRTAKVEDTVFADQKIGLMPEWTWSEGRAGDMEEDILQADTKDATNLQKALDALDKIEKDLDKFGKETLGVNIPVALAKTIVKAVKALVKAGVTLEQAIKQIAAEYNLSDRDVKSLLTPTKVSDIDVNEVRAKARPGKRISKGLSVKTVAGKKVIEETEDLSIEYVKKNAPKAFIANANIISKYPLVAGKKKFKTATTVEQAQEIYDVFVREVADNLNYLMAEFKPEYREISTLWYDGANAIANDFAAQFGVSAEQAAGIIAAMSPQKDWYQNVRLAEMVLMAYKDNPVMTKEMVDYQKSVNEKGLYDGAESAGKKLKKAQKEYNESRTKANKETLEEAKVKMQEAIEKADAVITMLNKYIGKKLNEVPAFVQPYMVRTYHEVNTTKDYNIVAPDGSVQGVAKNKDGLNAKIAWGSYVEIGKAVSIKNDGSQENITRSLGEMHKIRNFYNNIIDPMSKDGDVTMDTHAIAAALLLPVSGKSIQVIQNFGGKGTAASNSFGIKGLYYAYADAYALAAKEAGLLPRQVQSITWEAVRGLYTDTFKNNKAEVAKINNIWKDYQDGKITIDEAREQAKESAGGIKDPTWAGPVQTELGEGAGTQGVEGRGDGDERDTVGGTDGGGVLTADTKDKTNLKKALDVLNKADDDLAKFGRETLGINIPVATMRAIIKLAKVLVKTGITLQDAIIQAAEQKNVSKKDALNAIKFISETIKQPIKKVVINEMAALKSQIRLEARAAREAKGDINAKRKALAAAITSMVRQGKITALQARSIINKVSKVNLDNPIMVDRLISYAERVFDRADYQETLSKAAKIRKSIKKAMKSKDLQAEVAAMAKKFSSVDPFMVEDIDQYIENAEKVLNAVRPVRDTDVSLRQAVDIEAISEYTTAQFERQEANKKAELLALNKYLVDSGIVTEDMTAKEIQEMIDIIASEEYEVENADKKLNFLKNRFEFMAGVIKEMIVNNRDIFTDEPLDLTQSQKDLMNEVLKFDIDKLSVKQAAQVLEAMDNFINNGITSGLEAVVKNYIGTENANKLAASGLKSRPLKMYWNKAVGRFFGEQFVSLPLLIERMFPGMKKGLRFMSEMGLTDVIRGVAKADREHKMIVKDYTSQEFSKGKGFMKAENVYERGMIAFLSRNLAGTKTEMRNEFLRRIKMIEESINALMTGSETERKMGEAYQKVYDKLKVDSQDLDVIKANAEQMNLDAVNWMTQQWAEKYSDLSDISLSVYNAILGSDTNYTPDRYKALDEADIELDENLLQKGSAFMGGLEYTDKNKSGVLIETTRPKALPKGRFVSLDFDVNNFSSLKGAMIDIETAPAIRQVDGFIKSDGYKKMVNGDDRKILTRRINNYIISVKGKTSFNRDSMRSVERLANFLGSLGVGKALGGFDQTIKQTAPVIINTLINAGRFDGLNMEMNEAINRSGMPIANRGIEAISGVESVDALIDKKGATAAEIAKAIEKVSQMYMKALLSKPDVWVARSSFISYYKNYLKNNGMSTNIDWKSHEWNQDALNYAQMMVDRQQNISDEKLAGSFMSSPDPWKSVTRKVMLPFATFIINQKNRMHNDFVALFGRGAETSLEDKKKAARSLIGLSAEMLAYQAIAYFIKNQIYDNVAAMITGEDDEEEKKERSFFGIKMTNKQWNATKFPVKSLISDILSPFPLFDDAVVLGFDKLMSNFPMISDEDIKQAIQDQNDARMLKGGEPMDAEQETNFVKALKSKNTYAVTFQNESIGRQYGVPGIAFDTYTELAEMSRLAYTGEFEDDMGYGPKLKHISKKDQEIVKWTLLPMMLYSTGLVPKDAGVVSRKVVNTVKKRAISDNKFKNVGYLKDELGRKPKDWEESLVMNTTKKIPTLVDAIKFAERFGGLTESQGKEYAKLIELTGDYGYMDLKRIQANETADQIIKK
jgi:GNAT superfamily N-acetyltransferase